jgi:hypothetical protein
VLRGALVQGVLLAWAATEVMPDIRRGLKSSYGTSGRDVVVMSLLMLGPLVNALALLSQLVFTDNGRLQDVLQQVRLQQQLAEAEAAITNQK